MTQKKFGGVIESWHKAEIVGSEVKTGSYVTQEQLNDMYGPNLGYIIYGSLYHDPTGRFGSGPLRTSLVVNIWLNKRWKLEDGRTGKGVIETLNTIYHLGKPLGRTPKLGDFF